MTQPKFMEDYESIKDEFYVYYKTVRLAYKDGISPDVIIPRHSCHISDMMKYYNLSTFFIASTEVLFNLNLTDDILIKSMSEIFTVIRLLKCYQCIFGVPQVENITEDIIVNTMNRIITPDDERLTDNSYDDGDFEFEEGLFIRDYIEYIIKYYNAFIKDNKEFVDYILKTDTEYVDNDYKLIYYSIIKNGKENGDIYENSIIDDMEFDRDFLKYSSDEDN